MNHTETAVKQFLEPLFPVEIINAVVVAVPSHLDAEFKSLDFYLVKYGNAAFSLLKEISESYEKQLDRLTDELDELDENFGVEKSTILSEIARVEDALDKLRLYWDALENRFSEVDLWETDKLFDLLAV